MTSRKITRVAAAILIQPDGQFLLASRPIGKPYAGYWEFPGGKLEAGEAAIDALARELHEELGIEVKQATPWLCQRFDYPHALVELSFFKVTAWEGDLHAREGQLFAWQKPMQLTVSPILPANGPILRGLAMNETLLFSPAGLIGEADFLERAKLHWQAGPAWLVLREPQLDTQQYRQLCLKLAQIPRPHGGMLIGHGELSTLVDLPLDGVHLTSRQLMALQQRPAQFNWVGASTHNESELAQANRLGLDYTVLGHVCASASHPDQAPLGWTQFADLLAQGWSSPCFAIGGQSMATLAQAQAAGAQGVAILSAAWR
ncbi:Nudix family hydrolase [Chitinibacter bivalviorum]|uniref:8-oxo-dGTP diphosphatase n=1 Tax=Chitinibacter bivalviorum TaxID=2739434 RepID=A0A7H9BIH9_9NEIS|nr:Nudix family hydrolase [Chitinibacter bivalviorum]QLG88445.1 Nudix family hydrolase [Chitinibacter bivalviorum]